MTAPHAESGSQLAADVPWMARIEGDTDVQLFAKYAKQKIERFLGASEATQRAHANGSNTEVIRELESAERHAVFFLRGAVDLLHESINRKQESQ